MEARRDQTPINLAVLGDQEFADLYRANWKPPRTASVPYGGASIWPGGGRIVGRRRDCVRSEAAGRSTSGARISQANWPREPDYHSTTKGITSREPHFEHCHRLHRSETSAQGSCSHPCSERLWSRSCDGPGARRAIPAKSH